MCSNQIELIIAPPVIAVCSIWTIIGMRSIIFSPWINSCIGFYNRKAFILMLFYTTVMTFLNLLIVVLSIGPFSQKS